MRILLVEDEEALGGIIKVGLEASGYHVQWETDGAAGLSCAREGGYDLIVLDLMLPGRDGWTICQTLRAQRDNTPILMLTALGTVEERVRGLELGADDYLTKPFAFDELRARIRAIVRRDKVNKSGVIRIADLTIDTQSRRVERAGEAVVLTPREYALLEALALRQGQILSRETILERVWNDQNSYSNTVEVHIAGLRRKIDSGRSDGLIQTVHRCGYMLRRPDLQPEA